MHFNLKLVALGVMALLAVGFVAANLYVTDEGERVIVIKLGEVDRIQDPGLNFKIPFIEDKHTLSVRVKGAVFSNLDAYTKDNQIVTSTILIPYRVDKKHSALKDLYVNFGVDFEDELMAEIIKAALKEVMGDVDVMTLATTREKVSLTLGKQLKESLEPYHILVQAQDVKIKNLQYDKEFETRIAKAINEKAEVERARQEARKKEQQAIAKRAEAKGIADARREQGAGEAEYVDVTSMAEAEAKKRIGLAEAAALNARALVIKNNPELANLLRAEAALKWDGRLPQRYIPGAALPILQVGGFDGDRQTSPTAKKTNVGLASELIKTIPAEVIEAIPSKPLQDLFNKVRYSDQPFSPTIEAELVKILQAIRGDSYDPEGR